MNPLIQVVRFFPRVKRMKMRSSHKKSNPFERPIKARTLIAAVQSMVERLGLNDAEVTVSDNKRFLNISCYGADGRSAQICLVEDVFKGVG